MNVSSHPHGDRAAGTFKLRNVHPLARLPEKRQGMNAHTVNGCFPDELVLFAFRKHSRCSQWDCIKLHGPLQINETSRQTWIALCLPK